VLLLGTDPLNGEPFELAPPFSWMAMSTSFFFLFIVSIRVLEQAIVRSIDCTTGSVAVESVLGLTEDSEVRFLFPVSPVPSLGVPKTWICLYSLSLIEARYASLKHDTPCSWNRQITFRQPASMQHRTNAAVGADQCRTSDGRYPSSRSAVAEVSCNL
jgi:hypothetical protein